jgi:engulfment and cell motility protein 1
MDNVNVAELVERLGSDEDAVRKMAVFRLQSNVGDPSFAEVFILEGGLAKLKYLIMRTNGNTLAYSLASFSRLLEVDKGWECVEQDMIKRVGEVDRQGERNLICAAGGGAGRHTSTRQHPARSYGHIGFCRV